MLVVGSAALAIGITFGVALFAALIAVAAISATLAPDDRRAAGRLLRHPLRTIFTPDEPDGDEEDAPPA